MHFIHNNFRHKQPPILPGSYYDENVVSYAGLTQIYFATQFKNPHICSLLSICIKKEPRNILGHKNRFIIQGKYRNKPSSPGLMAYKLCIHRIWIIIFESSLYSWPLIGKISRTLFYYTSSLINCQMFFVIIIFISYYYHFVLLLFPILNCFYFELFLFPTVHQFFTAASLTCPAYPETYD